MPYKCSKPEWVRQSKVSKAATQNCFSQFTLSKVCVSIIVPEWCHVCSVMYLYNQVLGHTEHMRVGPKKTISKMFKDVHLKVDIHRFTVLATLVDLSMSIAHMDFSCYYVKPPGESQVPKIHGLIALDPRTKLQSLECPSQRHMAFFHPFSVRKQGFGNVIKRGKRMLQLSRLEWINCLDLYKAFQPLFWSIFESLSSNVSWNILTNRIWQVGFFNIPDASDYWCTTFIYIYIARNTSTFDFPLVCWGIIFMARWVNTEVMPFSDAFSRCRFL